MNIKTNKFKFPLMISKITMMIDAFLRRVDLSLSNRTVRAALLGVLVIFLFVGIKNVVRLNYLNTQYAVVERDFDIKKTSLMVQVLSNCQGDLSDPAITQNCIDIEKSAALRLVWKGLIQTKIKLFIWVVSGFLFCIGYLFLIKRQKNILAQENFNKDIATYE